MVLFRVLLKINELPDGSKSVKLHRYKFSDEVDDFEVPIAYQSMPRYHSEIFFRQEVQEKLAICRTQATVDLDITDENLIQQYRSRKFAERTSTRPTRERSESESTNEAGTSQESDSASRASSSPVSSGNSNGDFAQTFASIFNNMAEMQRQFMEEIRELRRERRSPENDIDNRNRRTSTAKIKLDINKYDGSKGDARQWIKYYSNICENNGISDDSTKITYLKSCLVPGSRADTWYDNCQRRRLPQDWESWERAFMSNFAKSPKECYWEFVRCRYRGGNIKEWYHEKISLLDAAYQGSIQDYSIILNIIAALPDELSEYFYRKNFKSLEEFREKLFTFDNYQLKQSKKAEQTRPKNTPANTSGQQAKPSNTNKMNSEKDKAKQAKPYKKPEKRVNNTAEEKESESDEEQEYSGVNNVLTDNSECLLKIESSPYIGLMDTGSQVDLIKPSVVRDLKLKTRKTQRFLKGFNGAGEKVNEEVDISLSIGYRTISITALISDKIYYPIIVGNKTLLALGFRLIAPELRINQITRTDSSKPIRSLEDVQKHYPSCLEDKKEPKIKVAFKLREGHEVVKRKPYPLTPEKKQWAMKKVDELLKRSIIRPSSSMYATPCVLPPKENGELRFCQDYRWINQATDLDPFPLPIIDDIISNLGGCQYFSKIDLADGFWQLGLTEDTKQYTAFVLPFGHYEMNRLPFGWKNSGAIFQRTMNEVMEELKFNRRIGWYVDDIVCGGMTEQECAENTGRVIHKLSKAINPRKCEFIKNSVVLLGRLIDGYTKATKQESVEKVRRMDPPYDIHTLRQFTGLTNHFRAYIPNYAAIVRPLVGLKKKDTVWNWTEECQSAFEKLKQLITSEPILQLPDWTLQFELCTDASNLGCGSVLYQRDLKSPKAKQLRVIGYQSYTFKKAERNYSTTEKEGLAVVKAFKYFRTYLEGRTVIVHTDHQAILSILNEKEPTGRLGRWITFLMGFDIKINHRSGKELTDADAMSRLCLEKDTIQQFVSYGVSNNEYTPEQKLEILRKYHDDPESGGHDGLTRTYRKINARFNWPNMREDIANYIKTCHVCQIVKAKYKAKPDVMFLPEHSQTPFEVLHIDYAELQKKKEGLKTTQSFLVIVDQCTRFTWARAMKESSKALIEYFKAFPQLSKVKTIISDNGKSFTSKEFVNWCESKGIKTKTTTPYNPQSNGMALRRIRDIKLYLSLYPKQVGGWKVTLQKAVKHLNRSFHSSIGCSPHFKAFGKSDPYPADEEFNVQPPEEKPYSNEQIQKIRNKIKENYDKRHAKKTRDFNPGDKILVRSDPNKPHDGPFDVKDVTKQDGVPKTLTYEHPERGKLKVPARNCLPFSSRAILAVTLVCLAFNFADAFKPEAPVIWTPSDTSVASGFSVVNHRVFVKNFCDKYQRTIHNEVHTNYFRNWCTLKVTNTYLRPFKNICKRNFQVQRKKRAVGIILSAINLISSIVGIGLGTTAVVQSMNTRDNVESLCER